MLRILVLDDDELWGRTLADRLNCEPELKCGVVPVTTAEQARERVESADSPFDVFLIDQRLGSGPDGIEVMGDLFRLSPQSDAIIFTGCNDPEAGWRAHQKGAFRYLSKPFYPQDLIWLLRSLADYRRFKQESNWLRILTDIAEQAQRGLSVRDVGAAIVNGGLRFGFERGRLWWLMKDEDGSQLWQGLYQARNTGLVDFETLRIPLEELPYPYYALTRRETVFFHGRELGPGYLDQHFADSGFLPSVGEWVQIPLLAGDMCIGSLALDNATTPLELRPDQRELLRLFANQASAALERARLYEAETRGRQELQVLNEIGEHVIARAALENLDALLWEVRHQVGRLMDVRNFMVVLLDEKVGLLDFRLHVEDDKRRPRHWRKYPEGLIGHLISENKPLFLPQGGKAYRHKHSIRLYGRPSRCWLGVPLCIAGKAMGAIAVQSYERERVYSQDDLRLLKAVADLIAGAIQTVRLAEREARSAQQLAVLHRASAELMRLGTDREDWLWHATLTAATAEYALSFNRALLFLAEEDGRRLRGRMGIGHFDRKAAIRDWRKDRRTGMDFEKYLDLLRSNRLKPTPVEETVRDWTLQLPGKEDVFSQVLKEGKRALIRCDEAQARLPAEYVERFGASDCAVVPLRAGHETLGLVVVDNIHDGKPLQDETLDHLETLLAQAALIYINLRHNRVREALLDANYAIMSEMAEHPMQKTLTSICEAAQAVARADCVLIYTLKPGVEPYVYDLVNTGFVGQRSDIHLSDKPRQQGVTAHILRSGMLVVPDVGRYPDRFDGQRLAEHPFLKREGIHSFIGMRVQDPTSGDPLGVLYLDYRRPQALAAQEVRLAGLFANLAAVAIRNARAVQERQAGLELERSLGEASRRELLALRRVLEEALTGDTDEQRVARSILSNTYDILEQPDVRVGLLLRKWRKAQSPEDEPREIRKQYFLRPDGTLSDNTETELYRGISGLAMKKGETQLTGDVSEGELSQLYYDNDGWEGVTRSELDVPIRLGTQVIGVINVESPRTDAFSRVHQAALERLAAGAALALDNVSRQEHLHTVLSAARAVTAPNDLLEMLKALIEAVQQVAPGISASTIWYCDPQDGRVRLGEYFGVHNAEAMKQEEPTEGSVVWRVMHSDAPIWAPQAAEEERLQGRFIHSEKILSSAAFPLRAAGEIVGAMFFNYRRQHEFSREERALFPILAEVTATSIRDASHLEQIRKERARLAASLEITDAVGTTLNPDEVLRKTMDRLKRQFPAAIPCVLLYSQDQHSLEFAPASLAFYHIDHPDHQGQLRLPVNGPGIVCRVARESLTIGKEAYANIADVATDANYVPHVKSTRSHLSVPLMSGGRLLGVLALESPQERAFSSDDLELLRGAAGQISLALDRAEQNDRLRFKTTVAALSAWAFDIAHDIKKEVGHIRNRADWLLTSPMVDEEGKLYAREIDESAARLAQAASGVRPSGLGPIQPFALDEFLRDWIGELARPRAPQIGVRWELGCPGICIQAHPEALKRVIHHLVRNAFDAMGKTGTLTVRTGQPDAKLVEVQIEDSGPGVPETIRHTIFHEPQSTKGEDRGFGLLFVRSVIEDMGGRVRLLPAEPGHGAVFAMRLPLVDNIKKEVSDALTAL